MQTVATAVCTLLLVLWRLFWYTKKNSRQNKTADGQNTGGDNGADVSHVLHR